MKIEDHEALDLLAACRQAEPEVVELALAVALAVRVEQPLLRSARLRLCPRLDAGAETGLWFSSLVSSSSASAFVIDHEILAHLREELRQRPQSWLRMARNIVADAHAQEADSLRLEEEIIWLSVRDGAFAAPEIDRRLRSAVKAMVNGPDQGLEVARWANRALLSLPETALQTESAALLAVGTASRLKTNSRNTDWGSLSDLPQGADWLVPRGSTVAPTGIGVRLRLGDYNKSIADFDGSLSMHPKDPWALYLRGIDKIRLGKTSEGQADMAAATALSPPIADEFKRHGMTP